MGSLIYIMQHASCNGSTAAAKCKIKNSQLNTCFIIKQELDLALLLIDVFIYQQLFLLLMMCICIFIYVREYV